ncbi:MAG: hypothetical protein RL648_1010 [Verrucomicrobiota bacterium]|jgi:hypothetical protein
MSSSSDILTTPAAVGSRAPQDRSRMFLLAGLVLMALSVLGLFSGSQADPSRPFIGWLLGISFWLSILIGMLFLLMIWWMFDAGWSVIVRRQMEHAIGAFPVLALIFLPLVVVSLIHADSGLVPWIWMDGAASVPGGHGNVAGDVLFAHKAPFLDHVFFVIRYVIYFGVWGTLAYFFRRWSFDMDQTGDHANVHRSRRLAAVGLFLCAFATTFASIDWFKSLSYHWFSTMYGVWFFSACMRAALSATVLALFYLATREDGLKGIVKPAHFYFLGCLMLAFTVFWAYISFSQYFLIYNANIPEETFWYNMRELGPDGKVNSWWWVSLVLVFLHFFFPFLFLLWYRNKFRERLKFIAVWILVFHLLDLYWNIVPQKVSTDDHGGYLVRSFGISWVDLTVFLGVGSLVVWSFLRSAAQHRPIPIRDPRIEESLNCHE